jgi:hypothetical protein
VGSLAAIVSLTLRLLAPNVSRKYPSFAGSGATVCRPLQLLLLSRVGPQPVLCQSNDHPGTAEPLTLPREPASSPCGTGRRTIAYVEYFRITLYITLRDMWVSSPVGAAYTEMFPHHSLNPGLILQVFRHHGQWQVTA